MQILLSYEIFVFLDQKKNMELLVWCINFNLKFCSTNYNIIKRKNWCINFNSFQFNLKKGKHENEKIDKETLEEAYLEHQKIFSKELDENIQSLLPGESDSSVKQKLESSKDSYLSKLTLNNQ